MVTCQDRRRFQIIELYQRGGVNHLLGRKTQSLAASDSIVGHEAEAILRFKREVAKDLQKLKPKAYVEGARALRIPQGPLE